jgi:hypothetical protein
MGRLASVPLGARRCRARRPTTRPARRPSTVHAGASSPRKWRPDPVRPLSVRTAVADPALATGAVLAALVASALPVLWTRRGARRLRPAGSSPSRSSSR